MKYPMTQGTRRASIQRVASSSHFRVLLSTYELRFSIFRRGSFPGAVSTETFITFVIFQNSISVPTPASTFWLHTVETQLKVGPQHMYTEH